jgi:hypothetical protein
MLAVFFDSDIGAERAPPDFTFMKEWPVFPCINGCFKLMPGLKSFGMPPILTKKHKEKLKTILCCLK